MILQTISFHPNKIPYFYNMKIHFSKYQGTGNDFVMLDNLSGNYNDLTIGQIQTICNRRFGIGADGLIKINKSSSSDFEMDYYNADGSKSFCGNGARCAVEFATTLGINTENVNFEAIDGEHFATRSNQEIRVKMKDVSRIESDGEAFVVQTGSPHFVQFQSSQAITNIVEFGKKIRYSEKYKLEGINVNLVQVLADDSITIETYERGVEDETLSCGTGATACALVQDFLVNKELSRIDVNVKGGNLAVEFKRIGSGRYEEIFLIGPAKFVFLGTIDV
jgi:diaminopimelate epimerase